MACTRRQKSPRGDAGIVVIMVRAHTSGASPAGLSEYAKRAAGGCLTACRVVRRARSIARALPCIRLFRPRGARTRGACSPGRLLRLAILDLVVVGLVGDEDVLDELEAGRRIERAGRDRHALLAGRTPEQIAAATAAKSALRRTRGAIPDETVGGDELEPIFGHARHRGMMTARAPALRAMTCDHIARRSMDAVTHGAAQTAARMRRFIGHESSCGIAPSIAPQGAPFASPVRRGDTRLEREALPTYTRALPWGDPHEESPGRPRVAAHLGCRARPEADAGRRASEAARRCRALQHRVGGGQAR